MTAAEILRQIADRNMGTNSTVRSEPWIDAADIAKIIRAHLKEQFEGVKFSVKTSKYSGGASISVSWTDRQVSDGAVRLITRQYEGASYDGSIDLQSYVDSEAFGIAFHSGAHYIFTNGPRVVRCNDCGRRLFVGDADCRWVSDRGRASEWACEPCSYHHQEIDGHPRLTLVS